MEILFPIEDDPRDWNDIKCLVRRHNLHRAKLLRRRLDDLYAAKKLGVMRNLPGRTHELKGDRAGQLSIDLDGPYRLVFAPANNPLPKKPNGGLDWKHITAVILLGVVNTHE
jgi:proteic killer suppression protein